MPRQFKLTLGLVPRFTCLLLVWGMFSASGAFASPGQVSFLGGESCVSELSHLDFKLSPLGLEVLDMLASLNTHLEVAASRFQYRLLTESAYAQTLKASGILISQILMTRAEKESLGSRQILLKAASNLSFRKIYLRRSSGQPINFEDFLEGRKSLTAGERTILLITAKNKIKSVLSELVISASLRDVVKVGTKVEDIIEVLIFDNYRRRHFLSGIPPEKFGREVDIVSDGGLRWTEIKLNFRPRGLDDQSRARLIDQLKAQLFWVHALVKQNRNVQLNVVVLGEPLSERDVSEIQKINDGDKISVIHVSL